MVRPSPGGRLIVSCLVIIRLKYALGHNLMIRSLNFPPWRVLTLRNAFTGAIVVSALVGGAAEASARERHHFHRHGHHHHHHEANAATGSEIQGNSQGASQGNWRNANASIGSTSGGRTFSG